MPAIDAAAHPETLAPKAASFNTAASPMNDTVLDPPTPVSSNTSEESKLRGRG
jgi:hypothetical protein